MATELPSLMTVYKGWDDYQISLVRAIAPRSREELLWRPSPWCRSAGEIAAHIVAGRVQWFHRVLGEGDDRFAQAVAAWRPEDKIEERPAELVRWLASVDRSIPLHFSRYFPNFEMQQPPTPLPVLYRAREIAREKLRHVYLGNVWDEEADTTFCPNCGAAVIRREGYKVRAAYLKNGKCNACGTPVGIVGTIWEAKR